MLANDIDLYSINAIELNRKLNNVDINISNKNFIGEYDNSLFDQYDFIILGNITDIIDWII